MWFVCVFDVCVCQVEAASKTLSQQAKAHADIMHALLVMERTSALLMLIKTQAAAFDAEEQVS